MSMPASLMGFGIFRLLRRYLQLPFTPVENVLLQSVACGMATMPLGCGLVGVIPAMEYLLSPDEQGPLSLSVAQLIIWSLGLCYFGVVFAVPLRRQVIIRERLRFPSGFSTAVLISVLHGQGRPPANKETLDAAARGAFASLVPRGEPAPLLREADEPEAADEHELAAQPQSAEWATNMRTLILCFAISGVFTICTYFFPRLRSLPIFGTAAAQTWLWTLNPSLAYVGQGIIMGAETTLHMTLGAVVGWGLLSPLARSKGWAPGPVDDWEHGSKGWIVWVSLAIMLIDTIRISGRLVVGGLAASVLLCILMTHYVIMGVRALGETDLNPVSGISKLAQLIFAFIVPQSNKSSVLVNLVAGAISEAGALQAGDLMQDLKTGHLLGAAPKAQFWGQVIGATVGAILSAFIYRLYTLVYTIPGEIFQVPTAYVWIFTARLVTGRGLPPMAKEWAAGAGALFACTTMIRTVSVGKPWRPLVPGGIAVAVGMYNIPSFTLARAAGGLLGWYWVRVRRRSNTPLIILASGFILGEGSLSIANLIMQGLRVPHF
ncbi:hypothetical protein G6O67_005706 [Ophiocordyceps sinensis]|uniref:Oligonucleotide transporter n=1 Tax=Ophiocordyceps sinensis TaxID=72228 RepID=A0A8H4LWW4_9HYPO|nr:hypothetical protein G6O67_005706 [Ophiocordyceps sinensis]